MSSPRGLQRLAVAVSLIQELALNIAGVLGSVDYLRSLHFSPYPWQVEALKPEKRLILNCARQVGKSTIVAAKTVYKAKYFPKSLCLIVSPSERQSTEMMEKVEAFMARDGQLDDLKTDNKLEKRFRNGSRIVALPASEKTIRGFSAPSLIVIDEASRVSDEMYYALRPMMTGTECELTLMSTPFGKRGFFYEAWNSVRWKRIEVAGSLTEEGETENEQDYIKARNFEGIMAWHSPRHTAAFLREELESMGKWWYSQEYRVKFVEAIDNVFDEATVKAMFTKEEDIGLSDSLIDNDVEVINL